MILADSKISGYADTICRNLIARLDAAYPAFKGAWCVTINEIGGTVIISNALLSGKMGCMLHFNKLDPEGRKVVKAGGELLERYRVARDAAYDIMQLHGMATDFRGELKYDGG